MTQEERYWKKVKIGKEDECWEWTGYRDRDGYGQVWWDSHGQYAHRVAWQIANGPVPDGFLVCHTCDNPPCCNINHLFLGSHAENMADRDRKGRQASGDQNGSRLHPESRARGEQHYSRLHPEKLARGERVNTAKLNEEKVKQIRKLCAEGLSQSEVAIQLDTHRTTVNQIVLRKIWKHVA